MKRLDTLLVLASTPLTAKLIHELIGTDLARDVITVDQPGSAIGVITNNVVEAVIMDAEFDGGANRSGVATIRAELPNAPILTLVNMDDEEAGIASIDDGADDFLLLDHVTPLNLSRALTASVQRRSVARELMRSQASVDRFAEVIEAADDLVLVIDNWERVASANRAAERFFGIEEGASPKITDILGSGADIWHEALPELMLTDRFQGEALLTSDSGESRDHRVTIIHHERADSADDAYYSLVAHDLAALRAAAEKVHMEQRLRAKDQFVASVSHELRTPLTAVLGFTELLHSGALDGQQEEMASIMQMISEQAQEVSSIVEDLMVGARSELGSVSVVPAQVSALAQVRSASDPLVGEFEQFTLDIDDVEIWVDPVRVRQIIRNLLTNARRYGGPHVTITSSLTEDAMTLLISDDGEGIPSERRATIFEPFHTEGSDQTRSAAVGLGLTISRQLAQLMGGNLTYDMVDGWSQFSLTVPRSDAG